MRIGIIGQPCIDEIIAPNGAVQSRSLGGILYSYAAMERLIRESGRDDSVVPLTWLSTPDLEILNPVLSQFLHLDSNAGFWPTNELTNRVQLVYHDDSARTEHCPVILPQLSAKELTPELLSSLDALFVNMISGFDITSEVLSQALSETNPRPYVHLDIHALILGELSPVDQEGFGSGRKPSSVKDWRTWLMLADSIQLNELELQWFAAPEITTEAALLSYLHNDTAHHLKHLIVTRAERGASIFDLSRNSRTDITPPMTKPIDPTGSGDVFGAVFLYSLMLGRSAADSVRDAVHWASWNTTLSGIDSILTAASPIGNPA